MRASIEERTARAAKVADARKAILTGEERPAPSPKPKAKTSSSPRTKESAPTSSAAPASSAKKPETSSSTESGDEASAPADSADKKLEQIGAALEKLDFKTAAKLAGKESKALDDAQEKFHVIRRQRERLTKRETHLDGRQQKLEKSEIEQKQRYGDPDAIRKAYEEKNYVEMGRALVRWCGDDFVTITQKIARATAGFSKEKIAELERNESLERENRKLKADRDREQTNAQRGATRKQALAVIPEKVKGSPVLELDDGAELVLAEMERNFDGASKTFRITFAQAAQRVLAREDQRATKLGYTKAQREAAEEADAEVEESGAAPPAVRPKPRVEPMAKAGQRTLKSGKVVPSLEERTERARRLVAQRRGG